MTVKVAGVEHVLHLEMIEPYRADMLGFFEELAAVQVPASYRWESEFAELHLDVKVEDEAWATFEAEIWWCGVDSSDRRHVDNVVRRFISPRPGPPRVGDFSRRTY